MGTSQTADTLKETSLLKDDKKQPYLPVSLGMTAQARQGRQPQVTGAASGQCLHEQRFVGAEAHNSHLVMEQLWCRMERSVY